MLWNSAVKIQIEMLIIKLSLFDIPSQVKGCTPSIQIKKLRLYEDIKMYDSNNDSLIDFDVLIRRNKGTSPTQAYA